MPIQKGRGGRYKWMPISSWTESWLELEGDRARMRATDLMLDAPSRRSNGGEWRRALVHDFQDGLTINFAGDYPGGVHVVGETSMDSLKADSLHVAHEGKFVEGVVATRVLLGHPDASMKFDVMTLLQRLQQQVEELKAEVDELKGPSS